MSLLFIVLFSLLVANHSIHSSLEPRHTGHETITPNTAPNTPQADRPDQVPRGFTRALNWADSALPTFESPILRIVLARSHKKKIYDIVSQFYLLFSS